MYENDVSPRPSLKHLCRGNKTRTLSALTPPSPHLTEVIDVLTKLNHPPPYPTHLIARAIALVSDPTKILSECTVTDEIARKFRENSTRLVTALQTNHAALPVTIKAFLQQLNSALAYQQGLWAPVIDRITALFVQCLRDATLKFVVQPLLQPLCPTHIPPLVIPPSIR